MGARKLQGGASWDAILLMVVKLVTILAGFVVTRLLSQYLSTFEYGTYSQAMLLVSTVSSLTILGMMDGVNYFYCSQRDPAEQERYTSTIFACQCVVSIVVGVVVLAMADALSGYYENPSLKKLLVFCAVLPLTQNLLGMLQVLLVSVGKARMLAARSLIVSLVRLLAVILVVFVVRDVGVVLLANLLTDIVQILFFVVVLRKKGCMLRCSMVDFRLVKRIFSYCAPMAVFVAVNALNRDLDKHLIAFMTDTETLALYTNASRQLPFDILATSFCTILLPKVTRLVSEKNHQEAKQLYKLFLEIAYISTTMLCGAALSVAPQLVQLLYSEKYMGVLEVFRIYILVDMIRFASITLILSAAGKTKLLMLMGISTLGMNAVLNVVFYLLWGINGPAIATAVTSLTMGILLLYLSARELEGKLHDLFDGRCLFAVAVRTIICVGVFSLLGRWIESKGVWYFLILVIVGIGYCLTFLLFSGKRLLKDLKRMNRVSRQE